MELNPSYLKAYLRRAQLYEETDKLDEALEDFKKVLTFDPVNSEANYAVRVSVRLPATGAGAGIYLGNVNADFSETAASDRREKRETEDGDDGEAQGPRKHGFKTLWLVHGQFRT